LPSYHGTSSTDYVTRVIDLLAKFEDKDVIIVKDYK